jgi:hypothetical protein
MFYRHTEREGEQLALRQALEVTVRVRSSGVRMALTAVGISHLPTTTISVPFEATEEMLPGLLEGPLLWTALEHLGVVDPKSPRQLVSQALLVTGRDGHTAVVALCEIAPEFEGKPVILARRLDGQPLSQGRLHIIVPGDRRGGRSIRDVASLEVCCLACLTP